MRKCQLVIAGDAVGLSDGQRIASDLDGSQVSGHLVSRTLAEGDRIAGFSVLQVQGHSPGHLAFWRERDRVLVLGDVLPRAAPAIGPAT